MAALGAGPSLPCAPFPFAEEAGLTGVSVCASALLSNAAAEEWKLACCPGAPGSCKRPGPTLAAAKVPARTQRVSCAATSRAQSSLQPRGRSPRLESPGSSRRELGKLISMTRPVARDGIKEGKACLHQELGFGRNGPNAAVHFFCYAVGVKNRLCAQNAEFYRPRHRHMQCIRPCRQPPPGLGLGSGRCRKSF